MPYIQQELRDELLPVCYTNASTPGELNFQITCLLQYYLEEVGECYQTYNDMLGALEGAKLELYRRKVAEYEGKKIFQNGDVY